MKKEEVEELRMLYPKGSVIELDYMDEVGMEKGLQGEVERVDEAGQIHVKWENGRSLALVPEEDRFHGTGVQRVESMGEIPSELGLTKEVEDWILQMKKEEFLEKVVTSIVPYERNKGKFSQDLVVERLHDLAVYGRVPLNEHASMKVTKSLLERFDCSSEEMFESAKANLREKMTFQTMSQKIGGIFGEEMEEEGMDILHVLEVGDGVKGAALMADDVVLDVTREQIGNDFYILPSSIHELIVVEKGQLTEESAVKMVKEANEIAVDVEEQLSNNIYFYDGEQLQVIGQEYTEEIGSDEQDLEDSWEDMER